MHCNLKYLGKVVFALVMLSLPASLAVSADDIAETCIDISTTLGTKRVLELAVRQVSPKYYSLAGSHQVSSATGQSAVAGSAVGTAQVVGGQQIIATVNASSVVAETMKATLYQFNFDMQTGLGNYQSITQESINGSFVAQDHKSGQAKLVGCEDAEADFNGPTGACAVDYDEDGYCSFLLGGDDCADGNKDIHPGATEICGDGIDQDCSGADLPCGGGGTVDPPPQATCTDGDGDDYYKEGGTCGPLDCNDANKFVNPGMTEAVAQCGDGIDQDCKNGDMVCPVPVECTDADNDGYAIEGGSCGPVDCVDNVPYIYPGSTEVCGNRFDENCDVSDNTCTSYPEYSAVDTNTMSQKGTGLVWQRVDYDPWSGQVPRKKWADAVAYCEALVLGRDSDWRLPSTVELLGIVDLSDAQAVVKLDPRFTSTGGRYWSTTGYPNATDSAYTVDFGNGRVAIDKKTDLSYEIKIRCVRGN